MNEKRERASDTLLLSSQKACRSSAKRWQKTRSGSYRRSSLRTLSRELRGRRPGPARPAGARPRRPAARPRRDLAVDLLGQIAEVLDELAPVVGADRLGVELHAPQRPFAMRDAHHDAVGRPGRDLEALGQRLRRAQRVVADRLEPLRDAGEERRLVMEDLAQPAVHHLRAHGRRCRRRSARGPDARGTRPAAGPRRPRSRPCRPRSPCRALGGRARARSRCCRSRASPARPRSASSLRTTIGSSRLTPASSWKRLKVNES